jgi:hypothetical protein
MTLTHSPLQIANASAPNFLPLIFGDVAIMRHATPTHSPKRLVKSISDSQQEILESIRQLHCPSGFDCDASFGNGVFGRGGIRPRLCFDIAPQAPGVKIGDSECLPLEVQSIGSLVFDPPFLTYVRAGRTGNGKMAMAKRYSGYWTYGQLEDHYINSISEAWRVLKPGGVYVFKCQDIVHNHKLHATHVNVIQWAEFEGFRLMDLFILRATRRMPSPNRKGTQKHARIFHSYFLVFEKPTQRRTKCRAK